MLDFYTELGQVHKKGIMEMIDELYTYDELRGKNKKEYKLTKGEVINLVNAMRDASQEIIFTFLGLTKEEYFEHGLEKKYEIYKNSKLGNTIHSIVYELFKGRKEKTWNDILPFHIREARDKVLILYLKDLFKRGNLETEEQQQNFIDKLKAVEKDSPVKLAKRINALSAIYERFKQEGSENVTYLFEAW
jgi:hypothetical protein